MNDDRSLERAARSFIEAGPTEAPDRVVEAALGTIQSTPQERDWHVPWRNRPMTLTIRLLAGAAALAVVVVGGAFILRPGAGPDVGGRPSPAASQPYASPTASGPVTACKVLSNSEVAAEIDIHFGATSTETGTTCTYSNGPGETILKVTYTNPGGRAAFASAKNAPGIQVLTDIGTDAVLDPASSTIYLAKGDVMVAVAAGTPAQATHLNFFAKLVAGRI
jgi:hypothetical protein